MSNYSNIGDFRGSSLLMFDIVNLLCLLLQASHLNNRVHISCLKFVSKQKSFAIPIGNIKIAIHFHIHNEFSKKNAAFYIVIIGSGINCNSILRI